MFYNKLAIWVLTICAQQAKHSDNNVPLSLFKALFAVINACSMRDTKAVCTEVFSRTLNMLTYNKRNGQRDRPTDRRAQLIITIYNLTFGSHTAIQCLSPCLYI